MNMNHLGMSPSASPVATTPTLVFAGNVAGYFMAYDLEGGLRWMYKTGASMYGGAAIVDGTVYVGSGSGYDVMGLRGHRLYAFSIGGA